MTAPTRELACLAHEYGVATDYTDWQGTPVVVSAETITAVLAAFDVDASSAPAVEAALRERRDEAWARVVPPTVVTRVGHSHDVPVHVPDGVEVRLSLELEDGTRRDLAAPTPGAESAEVDGVTVRRASVSLPADLPLGWHALVAAAGDVDQVRATLVVTPDVMELPASVQQRQVWGVAAQLYQVLSHESWGVGDLRDLAELTRWSGSELGADYVLVNPLHAAEPSGPMEPSPYLPTTRRFANPLYLHVEDVPEVTASPELAADVARLAEQARSGQPHDRIDRDVTWAAKREALRAAFDRAGTADSSRVRDYRAEQGEELERFATWCALADVHGLPWTDWPDELQDPTSSAVATFRDEHAADVAFHAWLQLTLDDQLARAQAAATESGMSLGVVHDLAVGVHPVGADAWSLARTLARGVTVGAPPDAFNQMGQNWNQPPWRPDRLAETGYTAFRDMLRAILRDSGGIRVDHVIGLFRLWWIPDGGSPADGTYVRFDHEAMIGILALEAQRVGAVVVGEDLGVVEPSAREYLRERGILGTSILWFERGSSDEPLAPQHYRELCMATVTTHDLPPTAGYLQLEHLRVREELELLTRAVEEERESETRWIGDVRQALAHQGLLVPDADVDDTVVALHRWIARTPCRMVGVALPDLAGDVRSINQPGTYREYPNWSLPLAGRDARPVALEDLRGSALAQRIADAVGSELDHHGGHGTPTT